MTTELASTTLAICETYRDANRSLTDDLRHQLETLAGLDSLPAGMRSEARRLLIADRAGAR